MDRFLLSDENKSVCYRPNSNKECDAITCGSHVLDLNSIGLWPQKSPDKINISVQDLATKLGSLKIWTYPALRNTDHYNCGLVGFKDQRINVLSSMPSPVLESHRRHLRIQAMK